MSKGIIKAVPKLDVRSMLSGLITDYVYAIRSSIATEACSKRPRDWVMNGLMSDGIRNVQQAQVIVEAKGRIVQPGPFDMAAQQLEQPAAPPAEDPLNKILAHMQRTDKTISYLKRELGDIKKALPPAPKP